MIPTGSFFLGWKDFRVSDAKFHPCPPVIIVTQGDHPTPFMQVAADGLQGYTWYTFQVAWWCNALRPLATTVGSIKMRHSETAGADRSYGHPFCRFFGVHQGDFVAWHEPKATRNRHWLSQRPLFWGLKNKKQYSDAPEHHVICILIKSDCIQHVYPMKSPNFQRWSSPGAGFDLLLASVPRTPQHFEPLRRGRVDLAAKLRIMIRQLHLLQVDMVHFPDDKFDVIHSHYKLANYTCAMWLKLEYFQTHHTM